MEESVVRVLNGDAWGTGFIINSSPGLVITCAHVIHQTPDKKVRIRFNYSLFNLSSRNAFRFYSYNSFLFALCQIKKLF